MKPILVDSGWRFKPEATDLEDGISIEPDWRNATWEAVQERNPPMLDPGEHIELTHVNYDFRLCPDSPDRNILWDLRARRQLEWRDPPPGRLVFPGEAEAP